MSLEGTDRTAPPGPLATVAATARTEYGRDGRERLIRCVVRGRALARRRPTCKSKYAGFAGSSGARRSASVTSPAGRSASAGPPGLAHDYPDRVGRTASAPRRCAPSRTGVVSLGASGPRYPVIGRTRHRPSGPASPPRRPSRSTSRSALRSGAPVVTPIRFWRRRSPSRTSTPRLRPPWRRVRCAGPAPRTVRDIATVRRAVSFPPASAAPLSSSTPVPPDRRPGRRPSPQGTDQVAGEPIGVAGRTGRGELQSPCSRRGTGRRPPVGEGEREVERRGSRRRPGRDLDARKCGIGSARPRSSPLNSGPAGPARG